MASLLKEYGKIIVLLIAVSALFLIIIGEGEEGILQRLQVVVPKVTQYNKNNVEILATMELRKPPILCIEGQKLELGRQYNFLEFVTEAKDYTGKELKVEIVQITNPQGGQFGKQEVITMKGSYHVLYRTINDRGQNTTRTVCFVAD